MRPCVHAGTTRGPGVRRDRVAPLLLALALALGALSGCENWFTPEQPPPPAPAGRYVLHSVNGQSPPYREPNASSALLTDTLWLHPDGSFARYRVWQVYHSPVGPHFLRLLWSGETRRHEGGIVTLDSATRTSSEFSYTASVAPAGLSSRDC